MKKLANIILVAIVLIIKAVAIIFGLAMICLFLIIAGFDLTSVNSCMESYVKHYTCDVVLIDSYKDKSTGERINVYQTDDEYAIEFKVIGSWKTEMTPFGFKSIFKHAVATSDFGDMVNEYFTENYGTYNIENKSIDEITEYVVDVMNKCSDLFDQYRITRTHRSVTFTFVDNENTYEYVHGYTEINEDIIEEDLEELLYQ